MGDLGPLKVVFSALLGSYGPPPGGGKLENRKFEVRTQRGKYTHLPGIGLKVALAWLLTVLLPQHLRSCIAELSLARQCVHSDGAVMFAQLCLTARPISCKSFIEASEPESRMCFTTFSAHTFRILGV